MKALLGIVIVVFVLASCANEPEAEQVATPRPPSAQKFMLDFNGLSFAAKQFKAYAKDGNSEGAKEILLVGESESGDVAEIHIKDVNQEEVSFNVAKGAMATLSYHTKGSDEACTTALTMGNDSSLTILQHDEVTNALAGSFTAVSCAQLDMTAGQLSQGLFSVKYEEVDFDNTMSIQIDGEEVATTDIFVQVIPEPMNTIQITGFKAGSQSYTLILKSDLPAGTYQMNEFDVAPYFFFSDNALNQFDATGGTVTLEPYDRFERILRGSFDIETQSGTQKAVCTGDFEIFVF